MYLLHQNIFKDYGQDDSKIRRLEEKVVKLLLDNTSVIIDSKTTGNCNTDWTPLSYSAAVYTVRGIKYPDT
jgi:hypothetical protein